MKKILLFLAILFSAVISNNASAQGNFTVGLVVAGSPYAVSVKDVKIAGSATQGSNIGNFLIEHYGYSYVGGANTIIGWGSFLINPPSFANPLLLHSRPSASTSYVTFVNTAATSKSVTIEQYYSGILVQTESFTVPASTGPGGYQRYLTQNASKTYTSRAPIDWGGTFPQTTGEYAAYVIKVIINN